MSFLELIEDWENRICHSDADDKTDSAAMQVLASNTAEVRPVLDRLHTLENNWRDEAVSGGVIVAVAEQFANELKEIIG